MENSKLWVKLSRFCYEKILIQALPHDLQIFALSNYYLHILDSCGCPGGFFTFLVVVAHGVAVGFDIAMHRGVIFTLIDLILLSHTHVLHIHSAQKWVLPVSFPVETYLKDCFKDLTYRIMMYHFVSKLLKSRRRNRMTLVV